MKKIFLFCIIVFISSLNAEDIPFVGLKCENDISNDKNHGIRIIEVFEQGPADITKLKQNDIILSFDKEKIYTVDQLQKMLMFKQVGDLVEVSFLRENKKQFTRIKIGKKKSYIKEKAYLGIIPMKTSQQDLKDLKLSSGLKVEVLNQTPAFKDGLKTEDIVLACNEEKIYTANQFKKILENYYAGDEIDLLIYRDSQKMKLKIKLESYAKWKTPKMYFEKFKNSVNLPQKISVFSRDFFNFGGIYLENIKDSLRIKSVYEESPLKDKLHVNDIVLAINDKKVSSIEDFREIYYELKGQIILTIKREGKLSKKEFIKGKNSFYFNRHYFKLELDSLQNNIKNFDYSKIDSLANEFIKKLNFNDFF